MQEKEATLTLLKREPSGKWANIPLCEFDGKRLGDAFLECQGQEVVAEFIGHKKGYICGTDKWVDYYKEKGFTAMSFEDAVKVLTERKSPLLDFVPPPKYEEVFPGSKLAEVNLMKEAENGAV